MSSTIQVRVDDELKRKSDMLFRELGTDTTAAVRIFLTQAVAQNGFPFEIKRVNENPYAAMSEEEILNKLEKSRLHASQGMYRDADEVISDMRAKYSASQDPAAVKTEKPPARNGKKAAAKSEPAPENAEAEKA